MPEPSQATRPRWYRLSGNKSSEAPSNLLFFDTESHEPTYRANGTQRELRLRLWNAIALRLERGAVTRRVEASGEGEESFWNFVASRQDHSRPLWAFAHNLGHDLTQLDFWMELWAKHFTIGPIAKPPRKPGGKPPKPWTGKLCLESRPQFAIVANERGKVKFVCTTNYFPTALAKLGKAFGIAKLPMPDWKASDEEWHVYCHQDCRVLEAAIVELIRWWIRERCGVFQVTAAMLSLTNWRHMVQVPSKGKMVCPVQFNQTHEALPMERASYYGGKFAAFFVGRVRGAVYEVDVNSMYLSVMKNHLFPSRRIGDKIEKTPQALRDKTEAYGATARVRINTQVGVYPARHNREQWHVTGDYWTTLCGAELRRALVDGHVAEVGDYQLYVLEDLFSVWAQTWYERKLAAKRKGLAGVGEHELAKLIGVSLHGKFGQHGRYWIDRPDLGYRPKWERWVKSDAETGTITCYRAIAGVAQELIEDSTPIHAFPAISAFICAHAREWMRSVILQLPRKSVYYQGSDQLLLSEDGFEAIQKMRLLHDEKLGAFKLVKRHNGANIRGVNNYTVGRTKVMAGLHGGVKHKRGSVLYVDRWQSLPELLHTYPAGRCVITEVPFEETVSTVKGTLGTDGWLHPLNVTPRDGFVDPWPSAQPSVGPRPFPAV